MAQMSHSSCSPNSMMIWSPFSHFFRRSKCYWSKNELCLTIRIFFYSIQCRLSKMRCYRIFFWSNDAYSKIITAVLMIFCECFQLFAWNLLFEVVANVSITLWTVMHGNFAWKLSQRVRKQCIIHGKFRSIFILSVCFIAIVLLACFTKATMITSALFFLTLYSNPNELDFEKYSHRLFYFFHFFQWKSCIVSEDTVLFVLCVSCLLMSDILTESIIIKVAFAVQ